MRHIHQEVGCRVCVGTKNISADWEVCCEKCLGWWKVRPAVRCACLHITHRSETGGKNLKQSRWFILWPTERSKKQHISPLENLQHRSSYLLFFGNDLCNFAFPPERSLIPKHLQHRFDSLFLKQKGPNYEPIPVSHVRGSVFLWIIRLETATYTDDPLKFWYRNIYRILFQSKCLICKN